MVVGQDVEVEVGMEEEEEGVVAMQAGMEGEQVEEGVEEDAVVVEEVGVAEAREEVTMHVCMRVCNLSLRGTCATRPNSGIRNHKP